MPHSNARKLPNDTILRRLHAEGKTTVEIARTYGCSRTAVSQHWARLGLEARNARHSNLIPWRVASEHCYAKEAIYLRFLSRFANGETIADRRAQTAIRWAKSMEDAGMAVQYVPGWGFRTQQITKDDTLYTIPTPEGAVVVAVGPVEDDED